MFGGIFSKKTVQTPAPIEAEPMTRKILTVGSSAPARRFWYKIDPSGRPTEIVGRGGFGKVCSAYREDAPGESWVVKIQRNQGENYVAEAKYMNDCAITTYPPIFESGKVYTIMGRIPGVALMDAKSGAPPPQLQSVSFEDRAKMFLELALIFSNMHFSEGIIHRDIKGDNILFSAPCSLIVIDYNLAIRAHSANPDQLIPSTAAGTADHVSPEVLNEKASVKSDIYGVAPTVAAIFGAENPLKYRLGENPYDSRIGVEGIFLGNAMPPRTVTDLAPILLKFIVERMGDSVHQTRTNTVKLLHFAQTLVNLVLRIRLEQEKAEAPGEVRSQAITEAKSVHELYTEPAPARPIVPQGVAETVIPYDEEAHYQLCKTLVLLAAGFSLEASTAEMSFPEAKTVIVLWEAKLLAPNTDLLARLNTDTKRLAFCQLFYWNLLDQNRRLRIINDTTDDYAFLVKALIPCNNISEAVKKFIPEIEKNESLFKSVLPHLRDGTMVQAHLERFVRVIAYLLDPPGRFAWQQPQSLLSVADPVGNIVQLTQNEAWSCCILEWPSRLSKSEFQQLQQSNIYSALLRLQQVIRYQAINKLLAQVSAVAYPGSQQTVADVVNLCAEYQSEATALRGEFELVLGSADYRQAILVLQKAGLLTSARLTQIMQGQQVACVLILKQKSLLCTEYLDWINLEPRLQKILLNYPEDISIETFNQWCLNPPLRDAMATLVDAQIPLTSEVQERLQRTVSGQLLATILITFDGYWQNQESVEQRIRFLNCFIAEEVGLITLIHRLDGSGANSVSLFNQLANAPDLVAQINALLNNEPQLVTHVLDAVNGLARVNRLSEPTLTAAVSVMRYAQTKRAVIAEHGVEHYTGRAGARVARLFSTIRVPVRIPLPQPAGVKLAAAEAVLARMITLSEETVAQGLLSQAGTPLYRAMLHGELGGLRGGLERALAHP